MASQAAFDGAFVIIWDTRSGKELHRLDMKPKDVHGESFVLAFSPDGKLLASGGNTAPMGHFSEPEDVANRLRLWNVATGKQERLFTQHDGPIRALAFSRDGKTLISGATDIWESIKLTIRLWEVGTGQECRSFTGQGFISLSPDDNVMATSNENGHVLNLVNWGTGKTLLRLKDFPGIGKEAEFGMGRPAIASACFSPDGKVVATTCRYDTAIRLWDARSGNALRTIPLPAEAYSTAFSPDGKTLAVGALSGYDHNRIRLFDPGTGNERMLSPERMAEVYEVRFLPGGKALATTSADKQFRLWQPTDGKAIRVLTFAKRPLAMAPDGSLVAVSGQPEPGHSPWGPQKYREETVDLCDTTTGKVLHQLKHNSRVATVAWSPDGTAVAVGTEEKVIYVWDVATGKWRNRWNAPATFSLVFSPDGKTLATGDDDGTVQLWQTATGQSVRRLGKPVNIESRMIGPHVAISAAVHSIAFSLDGKAIAAVPYENTITVWNTASGVEICRCLGTDAHALAFSPDGKILFGNQDRTIRLWDAATGKERAQVQGHRGAVHTLAVSPDGARLASGSNDGTILLWDLAVIPASGRADEPDIKQGKADDNPKTVEGDKQQPLTVTIKPKK